VVSARSLSELEKIMILFTMQLNWVTLGLICTAMNQKLYFGKTLNNYEKDDRKTGK
jgi:hypothetical protein